MLKYLGDNDYIEQLNSGEILLSRKGEYLVEDYKFYSVFKTLENWRVIHNGVEIGEIPLELQYQAGDQIILAGKRWQIEDMNPKTKTMLVVPSKAAKSAIFLGGGGITSKKLHQKMYELYQKKCTHLYINKIGLELLTEGYDNFNNLMNSVDFFPIFQGTKISFTIFLFLKSLNINLSNIDIGFILEEVSKDEIIRILKTEFNKETITATIINQKRELKELKKNDY